MGKDSLGFITLKLSTLNLGEGILNVENRSRLKWGYGVLGERRLKGGIRYRMHLQG
jgi:hypothetical protein